MVESSDAVGVAVDRLIDNILAGNTVESQENQLVDCKEDPSCRGQAGAQIAGIPQSNDTANLVADALACLANADGGAVILGIADKAGGPAAIAGTPADVDWLRGRVRQLLIGAEVQAERRDVLGTTVIVLRVAPSFGPVADTKNRYRRRHGRTCEPIAPSELGSFSVSRTRADWSAESTPHAIADVDPRAVEQLRRWLRASNESNRIDVASLDDRSLVTQLGLCSTSGNLNRAGELLLVRLTGRSPLIDLTCRDAPGAVTTLRLDRAEEPLAVVLAEVEEAVMARLSTYHVQSGLAIGQFTSIPRLVLREALVNGVAHRDWGEPGPIRVQLDGDHLVVMSPGGFLSGVRSENLITTTPRSRNPVLASALRSLRLAESEGSGIDRMFRETVRTGLPTPALDEIADGAAVRCAIVGGPPDPNVLEAVASLDATAVHDVDIVLTMRYLESHSVVTATRLAPAIQKSQVEAVDALRRSAAAGLTLATSRSGCYRLTDQVRTLLSSRLPYLRRTREDYVTVIRELLSISGEVRPRDLMESCQIGQVQASRVLAGAVDDGIVVKHGTTGRAVRYTAP